MKKLIIYISLFFLLWWINQSFSDSGSSSTTWNNNVVECPTESRHWITHYWVPNSNSSSVWVSWTLNCITHTYYSSSDHTVFFTYNNWWITSCPPWERAVSWNWVNSITCRKFDDTPPSSSDITSNQTNGWYFRASTSFPISISWNASWWSPITLLQWQFEDFNSTSMNSAKSSTSDNNSSTSNVLETNENISKVDTSDRTSNNYRNYLYNITNICDEAGNCTVNPTSFSYNVYAWYVNLWNSSISWISNFVWQIADASTKTLTLTLNDAYYNKIIPVYQSNGFTPVRTIDFNLNYNNSLYLNQYNKTWDWIEISWIDDSVYANSVIWNSQTKTSTISSKINNDWVYNLSFKVYSPTYSSSATDWRQFVDGNFNINNIVTDLSDNSANDNIYWNIDFEFKPLYKTSITWSVINKWFIVGTTQTWTLDVTPSWSKEVYLEYGYYDSSLTDPHRQHNKIDLNYKKSSWVSWDVSAEGYKTSYSSLTLFWTSSSNLFTKLVQNGTLTTAEQKTYLATHIKTTVWWKEVVYSSDIYWMNRYNWTPNWDNTSQRWVKITWITHSQNQVDLVSWQSASDISILWNLEKSYLQRDVRENAYSLIKNISPSNWAVMNITNVNQSSPWKRLGDVLYFWWLNWDNVVINLSWNYSWIKTIFVEWWNVYVKSNILASNKSTDILWIVSLKNNSWNWWNIYIHPDVLEVDAVLYADRAIVSYDGSEISPDNWWTYEYLSKQLYIYWTVFSNNTIGWSVDTSNLKCPFYITTCNLDTAQKYDMNYLRRWYEVKRLSSYQNYPVIINYNPLIQLTPPPLFEKK